MIISVFREVLILLLALGFLSIYFYVYNKALRYSHRGRVTLLLQPKRVTRKGRHCSYALEKQGTYLGSRIIMLRQNSQRTLRHAGAESP